MQDINSKKDEIKSETEYKSIHKALNEKKQPPAILRYLMNTFEAYRASRKIGWSRPWNKKDLMNFQSLKLKFPQDGAMLNLLRQVISDLDEPLPNEAQHFIENLISDQGKLMGFVFSHEFTDGIKQYEGATFSLGRVNNKRYRDRLDIIVESEVIQGVSQGFSRMRLYIDPWQGVADPLWVTQIDKPRAASAHHLFAHLSRLSWNWARVAERQWDHWTSAYIDYFGDRQWRMKRSIFYTPDAQSIRIDPKSGEAIIPTTRSESAA